MGKPHIHHRSICYKARMPRNKKNKPKAVVHSFELLSKISSIDYNTCVRNHMGGRSDSDPDSSGESDFNEEYYNNKPPPLKLSGSTPNLLNRNVECNTISSNKYDVLYSISVQNSTVQPKDAALAHSSSEANLNKKKSKKAKRKAKVAAEAPQHLPSILNIDEMRGRLREREEVIEQLQTKHVPIYLRVRSVSDINLSTIPLHKNLLKLKTPEKSKSLPQVQTELNNESNLQEAAPFRKPKKRKHSSTSLSSPEACQNKNTALQALPAILIQKNTRPHSKEAKERDNSLLERLGLLETEKINDNVEKPCVVKPGKKSLRKARARLRLNLSLDFSNLIDANLQGDQSVERLLETLALNGSITQTEPSPAEPAIEQQKVVKKPSKKARARLRRNLSLDFSNFINLNLEETVERLLEAQALSERDKTSTIDLTANSGDVTPKSTDLTSNSDNSTPNFGDLTGNSGYLTVNSGDLTVDSDLTADFEYLTANSGDFEDSSANSDELTADCGDSDKFLKAYEVIGRILNEFKYIEDGRQWEASDFKIGMGTPLEFLRSDAFHHVLDCTCNLTKGEKSEFDKLIYYKLEESKKFLNEAAGYFSDFENCTKQTCQLGAELYCNHENEATENFLASSDDFTPYFYSKAAKQHMDRHLKGFDSLSRNLMTSPQLRHLDLNRVFKRNHFVEKYTCYEFQAGIFQVSYKTMVDSLLAEDG